MSSPARRCLVAVCHNGPVVMTTSTRSLMELGWGNRVETAKAAHGFDEISLVWTTTFPRVDALRDSAASLAMTEGFSHLLFLDADMVWPSDVLTRMLAHHDRGIVGGLYVMRDAPFAPVALTRGAAVDGLPVQYEHAGEALDVDTLVPCEVLGMGCTLIPVDTFEKIGPRPWFEYANDADGWPRVTEDVPFCQKAAAAGVPIWLDPTVRCGHVATHVVDRNTARRYRSDGQRVADAMPLKIMTLPPQEVA